MEARQSHVCLVCHVGQGLVIFELLKIVEAIIKGGVALSGLPPATFAVAINELCQIIVNVHILFFQRTPGITWTKSLAAFGIRVYAIVGPYFFVCLRLRVTFPFAGGSPPKTTIVVLLGTPDSLKNRFQSLSVRKRFVS